MSAPSEAGPRTLAAPFGDTTHLELRFGVPPRARPQPRADLDVLLDGVTLAGVETLELALHGLDLPPAAATSVARLAERLPALRGLTVTIAGPSDPGQTSVVVGLSERCARPGLTLAVTFILDAAADAFDALGQHPGPGTSTSLTPVLEATRNLRTAGVTVRWLVPLVPALVYRLEAIFSLARDEGVEPVLAPASRLGPTGDQPETALSDEERLFVSDFVTYRLLGEDKHLHSPDRAAGYRVLQNALARSGPLPPATLHRVAVLYAAPCDDGFRWTLEHEERPSVGGPAKDASARTLERLDDSRAGQLVAQAVGVGGVLLEGGQALAQWMRAWIAARRRVRTVEGGRRFTRVLLIGAYGGEHIGDAAILGGVLFRINRRYGTTEAILMSQRPLHTRHLIPMLDTPFKILVEAYDHSKIRECLPRVDAVVFAGGPLIDLPKQLVKHLYAVALARQAGKPFIAEGIGPGPFPRWPSEWTARRIVCMADRISVRTSTDSHARVMNGLTAEVGRDPAFDYLATRGVRLSRLRDQDRQWIDRLLHQTDGRLLVGLNVRPIRHLFTVGAPAMKRAEYTRFVETRFEERLAEGMRSFHRASSVPPCFVFFPMNAIQFGMSDLRSAYRLKRLLRGDVDFRVWEADASLDGVVALLRRLAIVISMRFHATIFALAQQRRVIGIDYRVGERDKVGALLSDFGQSENCCRIDELTSDWILQRLSAFAASERDAPTGPALVFE